MYKKLILILFNQLFRFNKRNLALIILILIIIKLLANNRSSKNNNSKYNYTRLEIYSSRLNDLNINTDTYLTDYLRLKAEKTNNLRENSNNEYKQIGFMERNRDSIRKNEYLIVEYSKFFYKTKYCHLNNQQDNIFVKQCPNKNCIFSCDKRLANKADALLFYDYDLLHESTETTYYIQSFLQAQKKRKDQIWYVCLLFLNFI